MSESITTASPAAIGTHLFEQLYLYAFATQGEVHNYVRSQSAEPPERLHEILRSWAALQPAVVSLITSETGIADQVTFDKLPEESKPLIEKYVEDPVFKRTFVGLPTSVEIVEIDRLVAPQRTVNLAYVEKLSSRIPDSPNLATLLELCVSPRRDMEPIQHLEVGQNVHVFTSPNADIRFLGAFLKPLAREDLNHAIGGGNPAAAIISFVGYGTSSINVFKVGSRVILNNGFHRVYAIRSRGITHIPVVVQHVQNAALELPDVIAGLPKAYLLGSTRPVLIKDFFVPDFAIRLRFADRLKTISINVNVGQYDVPA